MPNKDDKLWLEHFKKYKGFIEAEGRFPVSTEKTVDGINIGGWLHNQIISYRKGLLPQDRLEILDSFNPVWKRNREEKQEENKRLLVASNWKQNVPDGETALPDTLAFEDLYCCLKNGIYSCEKFFEDGVKRSHSFDVKKKVFNAMYPQLDYSYAQLFSAVSGWQFGTPNEPHFQSAEEMQKAFQDVLKTLRPHEQTVIVLRFGLAGYEDVVKPMSLEEISNKYGRSRENIRQIEAKALRKLRHPNRKNRLFFTEVEIEAQRQKDFLHAAEGYSLDSSIEECYFSVRTFNCLKRAGFNTVGDLLASVDLSLHNPYEFLDRVHYLGRRNVEEVISLLEPYVKTFQEKEEPQQPCPEKCPSSLADKIQVAETIFNQQSSIPNTPNRETDFER